MIVLSNTDEQLVKTVYKSHCPSSGKAHVYPRLKRTVNSSFHFLSERRPLGWQRVPCTKVYSGWGLAVIQNIISNTNLKQPFSICNSIGLIRPLSLPFSLARTSRSLSLPLPPSLFPLPHSLPLTQSHSPVPSSTFPSLPSSPRSHHHPLSLTIPSRLSPQFLSAPLPFSLFPLRLPPSISLSPSLSGAFG